MNADVPVRDASTVVLLRDGTAGLEVWLMTRVTGMVFAGGMAVFPGGRVDDADAGLPFASGSEHPAAGRLGCEPEQARALVGAAVREVFEETGVLLCVPSAALAGSREDVEAGRMSFGDLLRAHGLSVAGAAVRPWSRWVTPAGEVRRYDTRFFVAAMPAGAEAQEGTTEASAAGWFGVGAALESAQRGDLGMLPPTIMTLASLAGFDTVAEAMAAAVHRSLEPVRPDIERTDGGGYLATLPDGTSFPLPKSLFQR
ncbi:MAG: NUDIX hydrolase [Jatrophihabitantaceae bacterium]